MRDVQIRSRRICRTCNLQVLILPSAVIAIGKWWARQDSNLQPRDYESPALTVVLQAHIRVVILACICADETTLLRFAMVGLAGLFRTSICSTPLGSSHEHFRVMFKIAPSDFVEPTTCRSVDPFVALPLPSPLIEMQRLLESLRHRTPHDQLGRGIHFASSFPMSVDYLFIRERSGSFGRMRDAQRLLFKSGRERLAALR